MDVTLRTVLSAFGATFALALASGCSSTPTGGALPSVPAAQTAATNSLTTVTSKATLSPDAAAVVAAQDRRPEYMQAFPVYSPTPPPPGGDAVVAPAATPCPMAQHGIFGCQIVNGFVPQQGLFGGTLLGSIPGYHPSDLLSAYNLNRLFGSGNPTARVKQSASSSHTTIRTPKAISPSIARSSGFLRARRPAAALSKS